MAASTGREFWTHLHEARLQAYFCNKHASHTILPPLLMLCGLAIGRIDSRVEQDWQTSLHFQIWRLAVLVILSVRSGFRMKSSNVRGAAARSKSATVL